ncbi:MAG: hypothetical protein J6W64_03885 [Bacilli bacterium]|nr:hypothetical protein [Bacilli bacterium]MBO7716994.1 hypothetical protein [Methanobrevibacter sp.]MBO7717132.1 hypothetical protein [Methanobrevibacter sp.]
MIDTIKELCRSYIDKNIDVYIGFTPSHIIVRVYFEDELNGLMNYSTVYDYDVTIEDLKNIVDNAVNYAIKEGNNYGTN